jgi:hypothetical protein
VEQAALAECEEVFGQLLKLAVDAPSDLSIIRPTSGADQTENSLIINELTLVTGEEVLRGCRSKAVKKGG